AKPKVSPTPPAMLPMRNRRRSTERAAIFRASVSLMSDLLRLTHLVGSAFDRLLDAHIRHAAAEIAVHRFDDLLVGRIQILSQQRGRLHDLPGLAVAALRHLLRGPRLLQWMFAARIEPLDGDDLAVSRLTQAGLARAHCLAVEMDRAGSAER